MKICKKPNISLSTVIRTVVISILCTIFIFEASLAIIKYSTEPTSTKISYVMGDSEAGISFPQLTICDWDFTKNNPILNKCNDGIQDFLPALANCFAKNPNFNLKEFNESLKYDRRLFFNNLTLRFGTVKLISLEPLAKKIWYNTFHRRFGLCYTLDMSKSKEYRYIDFHQFDVAPSLQFYYRPDNHPWTWMTLMLHTENDLPDAMRAHPIFYPKATSKKSYLIKLRKKVLNKVSTKKEPCWNSQYETCHDIYDCKMIAEKYNCSILYLYSGAHMDHECYDKYQNIKEAECSHEVVKEVVGKLRKSQICRPEAACKTTKYLASLQEFDTNNNMSKVQIMYEDQEVEHYTTFINYGSLSLISEIGGILGLTLGISALSMMSYIEKVFNYLWYQIMSGFKYQNHQQ